MLGFHSISERPFSAIELVLSTTEEVSVFSDSDINVEHILDLISPASQEGLMNGMVAYWKLDESGGVRSDSYNSHSLSDFNTVLSDAGMFGNSASFYYGSKEYLYLDGGGASVFNPNNSDFSISVWLYFDRNMPLDTRAIFSKTVSTAPNWSLRMDAARRLGLYLSDGSASAEVKIGTGLSYETWYYAVAGYDSRANFLWLKVYNTSGSILYDLTTSYSAGGNASNASRLAIGANNKSGSEFGQDHWWGKIDEVGFWNKKLTANDISELINSGSYKTFPFFGHEGVQIDFIQPLPSKDEIVHLSWVVVVGEDGNPYVHSVLPISSKSEIKVDPEMPIEHFVRGLVADAGYPVSFLHDTVENFGTPIAFLSNIGPNLNLNLDWRAPIASDGVLDIEWVFELGVERSTYIGFLQDLEADSSLATEIIGTFGHEDIIPISFGGAELVPACLKWTIKNNKKLWTLGNNANTWTLISKSSTWTLTKRTSSSSIRCN